tara:strand:- start:1159 stop:1356 length:198 start_codon:yes stop_codon:yes gene_type:complete
MNNKDLLDELKERIKEGPVLFTPDEDWVDQLNDVESSEKAIRDAADSYDQIINKLNDDEKSEESI